MGFEGWKTSRLEPSELAKLRIFDGVDIAQLGRLASVSAVYELERGRLLLDIDQANDQLFVVLEGMLAVYLHLASQPIALLGRGDVTGEVSVIGEQSTSTYVRADTDCRLLVVGRNTLWRLFEESPAFARNFTRVFPRRLAHLHKILRAVQQLHEEYKQQSATDPLTGLYNRRWLEDSLSFELSRCQLRRRPLSLLMVDIDHFKRYNDDHGHMAGDEALKAVARAVLVALRGSDLAVRYGGEEIIVILPGVDLGESERVAERLHRAVADAKIVGADGRVLPALTVSIGVAQMVAEHTPEQLLAQVDQALYRAKRQGRNCTSA